MSTADDHVSGADPLDADLEDAELLEEIQVMVELMVATSNSRHDRLPQDEIDGIPGLASGPTAVGETAHVPSPRPAEQEEQ